MMSDLGCCLAWKCTCYELVGIIMHAEHLEAKFGVGPHTISVPRICRQDVLIRENYERNFR